MATEVKEFGLATELVLDWAAGNLYIDTPIQGDGEDDDEGLVLALLEAERAGLVAVSPEEMGVYEEMDADLVRIWLTPKDDLEVHGWL